MGSCHFKSRKTSATSLPDQRAGRINSQVAKHISFKMMQPLLMKTNYDPKKRAEDCKSNRKSKMDGTNKVLFK